MSLLSISLIIVAVFGIIHQARSQVIAATSSGDNVEITKDESVSYGEGWTTSHFHIATGGQNILGYCANPSKNSLEGTFPAIVMADSNSNNLIKLMIYIIYDKQHHQRRSNGLPICRPK